MIFKKAFNSKKIAGFFAALVFVLSFSLFFAFSKLSFASAEEPDSSLPVWAGDVAEYFGGGSGTYTNPYLISNGAQLKLFANSISANNGNNFYNSSDKYYRITSDIRLNSSLDAFTNWTDNAIWSNSGVNRWSPIGGQSKPFIANLDGNNHTIYGLYVVSDMTYGGFFGAIKDGTVKYLNIAKSIVSVPQYGGGIAGSAGDSAQIIGCSFSGIVLNKGASLLYTSHAYIGGIVGIASHSNTKIIDCTTYGNVHGYDTNVMGGIVGQSNGQVINCTNYADVTGGKYVASGIGHVAGEVGIGGITGYTMAYISGCANYGEINGVKNVGGIAGGAIANNIQPGGYNGSYLELPFGLIGCYNYGDINGQERLGGIAGYISQAVLVSCYNSGEITATDISAGGLVGEFERYGAVYNSYNVGEVFGRESVGGLIGQSTQSDDSRIGKSYNTGNVTATDANAGGLIGNMCGVNGSARFTISDCYNEGEVEGTTFVGGLLGGDVSLSGAFTELNVVNSYNLGAIENTESGGYSGGIAAKITNTSTINILNCYNAGAIEGTGSNTGSLFGYIMEAQLTNCFYATEPFSYPPIANYDATNTANNTYKNIYEFDASARNLMTAYSLYGNTELPAYITELEDALNFYVINNPRPIDEWSLPNWILDIDNNPVLYIEPTEIHALSSSTPDGTVRAEYSGRIHTVSRFDTVEVVSGDFPDGLVLAVTGEIFGIPNREGTFTFTVRSYNHANGTTDSETFTIVIYGKNFGSGRVILNGWHVLQYPRSPYTVDAPSEYNTPQYEYRHNSTGEWIQEKPLASGTHQVRAHFDETTNYLEYYTPAVTFVISETVPYVIAAIDNWTFGDLPPNPSVSGQPQGSGAPLFLYRNQSTGEWQQVRPSDAGTHEIKAVFASSLIYPQFESVVTTFIISRCPILKPLANTGLVYNGAQKMGVLPSEKYSLSNHTAIDAGTYEATIIPSYNYCWVGGGTEPYLLEYTIAKATGKGIVTISDWALGSLASVPVVNGYPSEYLEPVFYYLCEGETDWKTTPPTQTGTHRVKAVFAASKNYLAYETPPTEFRIFVRIQNNGSITDVLGWTYGDEPIIPKIKASTDLGYTLLYSSRGSEDYSSDIPTQAGHYNVKAYFVANDGSYKYYTVPVEFSIKRKPIQIPEPKTDLVYNGTVRAGVEEGTGYILAGASAMYAGNYISTAVPDSNHIWMNGESNAVQIFWSISKYMAKESDVTVSVPENWSYLLPQTPTTDQISILPQQTFYFKKITEAKRTTPTSNGSLHNALLADGWSTEKPATPGRYHVIAAYAETANTEYYQTEPLEFVIRGSVIVENENINRDFFQNYVAGSILPQSPSVSGYKFAGWYTTPDFSGEAINSIENLDENVMLYARYVKQYNLPLIIGIIVGTILFFCILYLLVILIFRKRKRHPKQIAIATA